MIALNLTFSHGIPEFQFIVAKIHFYSIKTGSCHRSPTCCTVLVLLFIEKGHSISTFVCCCILNGPLICLFTEENQYGPKSNPISQTIEAIKKSQTFAEWGGGSVLHPIYLIMFMKRKNTIFLK